MAREVLVKANQVKHRSTFMRIAKISLLIILLFLSSVYFTLGLIYREGKFTVELGNSEDSGLAVFENLKSGRGRKKLEAEPIKKMDNISYKWIPQDVDNEAEGSHNGENYIAYTFYVENQGYEDLRYWYELIIDDVIKDVDNAIRVMIYRNGKPTTYAKRAANNEPEPLTTPFIINPDIDIEGQSVIVEKRDNFHPDEIDKYTIVIWIEGDDPECLDNLIGGAIKMHMTITEEPVE